MRLAGLVLGVEALLFVILIWLYRKGHVITFDKPVDVAAIFLTAAGVVLTGVAVLIGIVAFLSYGEIKDKAIAMAKRVAEETASEVARPVAERTAEAAATNYFTEKLAAASVLEKAPPPTQGDAIAGSYAKGDGANVGGVA